MIVTKTAYNNIECMTLIGQGLAILTVRDEKLTYSKLQTLGFNELNMTLEFEQADKSTRRAHRNSKSKSTFLDG